MSQRTLDRKAKIGESQTMSQLNLEKHVLYFNVQTLWLFEEKGPRGNNIFRHMRTLFRCMDEFPNEYFDSFIQEELSNSSQILIFRDKCF